MSFKVQLDNESTPRDHVSELTIRKDGVRADKILLDVDNATVWILYPDGKISFWGAWTSGEEYQGMDGCTYWRTIITDENRESAKGHASWLARGEMPVILGGAKILREGAE